MAESSLQTLTEQPDSPGIHGRCWHHDKLVSADTGDRGRSVNRLAQTLPKRLDKPITGVVTEVIVDCFQAVEIDEKHRDWARLTLS